jgi:hypothetical protein
MMPASVLRHLSSSSAATTLGTSGTISTVADGGELASMAEVKLHPTSTHVADGDVADAATDGSDVAGHRRLLAGQASAGIQFI